MRTKKWVNHKKQLQYRNCMNLILEFIHQEKDRDNISKEIKTTKEYNLYEFQKWIWEKTSNIV